MSEAQKYYAYYEKQKKFVLVHTDVSVAAAKGVLTQRKDSAADFFGYFTLPQVIFLRTQHNRIKPTNVVMFKHATPGFFLGAITPPNFGGNGAYSFPGQKQILFTWQEARDIEILETES